MGHDFFVAITARPVRKAQTILWQDVCSSVFQI